MVTRTALTDFLNNVAERGDDGTIPAVGACAETIPIDAATQPLDLREAEVSIAAAGTGTVKGFNLAGATLDEVDLTHARVIGDAVLTDATIGELHLDQARIEERFICTGAEMGTVTADGARFEMVCDLHNTIITDECRLNEVHVDGILALTESEVDCPLFLNKSIIHGDLGITGTTLRGQVLAEHLRVHGECNAVDLTAAEVISFRRGEFDDIVDFSGAKFQSEARFDMNTTFRGEVRFDDADFQRQARFAGTHFNSQADFNAVTFNDVATFAGAQFSDAVAFGQQTEFNTRADFTRVTFDAAALFDTARIQSAEFTNAVCEDVLSLKSAQTGSLTLTEASLGNFDCQEIDCDGRLRLEDAVVEGTIDFSSSTFVDSVILHSASIDGNIDATDASFGDELDCRETVVAGTVRLTATENDLRCDSSADSGEAMIEGCAGFSGSELDTLVLAGAVVKGTVLAERAHIDSGTIAPGEESETTIQLTGTTVRTGTLAPPETGAVQFNLRQTVLGDVTLEPGPDSTSPLAPYWIVRAEFDGFRFTEHRELLVAEDWRLHGAPAEASLSPTDLEVTYLAAKNGANQVGARNAAGEFFKRELRNRRRDYRSGISTGSFRSRLKAGLAWGTNKTLDVTAVYGESSSRVIATAVLTIGAFSALSLLLEPTSLGISPIARRTLFSTQVFTAFIFGQPEVPTTELFQWLTAIESFLGAFLIGLFIFALTRSVSR
ncbi:MAG: pentapeptide repeat-containing protein [Haloarcula sp.]